jgi:type II secretory pathway component PulJ
MKTFLHRTQNGFTIIEVVIVIGLSTILLIGLMQLYEWHQRSFLFEEAKVLTTTDVRKTMQSMSEYIAQASSIQASRAFGTTTYTTGSQVIVLQVPSINASDTVIANTYDYIAFHLTNGEVYQIIEPASGSTRQVVNRRLADNVQTFTLTYDNATPASASAVTIDIVATISTRAGEASTSLSDTIFLRNQ